MMTFSQFTACLALVFGASSCVGQAYTIRGHVKGIDTGWAYVRHRQRTGTDSGKIVSGNFIIRGVADKAEFCAFGLSIKGTKDYYFSLFLQPGDLSLIVDKDSLNDLGAALTGSAVEVEFQQFQRMVAEVGKLHLNEPPLSEKLQQLSTRYLLKHRASYVSAFAICSYQTNLSVLAKLYSILAPEVQHSYFGKKIAEKLDAR